MNIRFNTIAIGIGACALLGVAGCTDLEEDPFGELVAGGGFGETEEEFLNLVSGAYSQLYRLQGNHGSLWTMNEIAADEMLIPHRGQDWFDGGQFLRLHSHNWTPQEASFGNAWNKLYEGVARFTGVIGVMEETNPEQAAIFVPEVRGLRALYYYYLLDNWGNVPIIRTGEDAEARPSTSSRQEVYDYVEAELLEIIPLLPEGNIYARMTADVARGLLAKLYLNAEVYTGTAQWQGALDLCNEIIENGHYELEDDYFINFDANNDASQENMFVIPYDRVFGRGFNIGFMTLHYSSQQTFQMTSSPWNGYASLQEFYESYDSTDLRKGEYGNQQIRGNFLAGPQFGPNGEERILDSDVEPQDPDGPPITFTPEINEIEPNALRQAGVRMFKYGYEAGTDPEGNNDYPILRYGDILLMKAECLLRLNGDNDEEAIDLVNMIRSRAFDDDDDDALYTELSLDDLYEERGREMYGEYYRRQDMIRFGTFLSGTWEFKPNPSEEFREIFPIPFGQLQANPNLVQNPGY